MVSTNSPESRRQGRDQGFTLVEVVIVVLIIGVLSAIAIFAIGGTARSAVVRACQTDWRTLTVAINAYRTDSGGTDPTSISSLSGSYLDPSTLANPVKDPITKANVTGVVGIQGERYYLTVVRDGAGVASVVVTGNKSYPATGSLTDCDAAIN